MSRAQKISLGVAAAVLIALGLVFAVLAGRSGSDATSQSSTPAPAQPIAISEMQVTGAPGSHGV